MPRERGAEISEQMLVLFDRGLKLRAEGATGSHKSTPLGAVDYELRILLAGMFGDHWNFGSPAPTGGRLDGACPDDPSNLWHINWPDLQRDRQALLAAHAAWKKRKAT